jgi:2-hydroxychromene-2-carboxylate isomerase
MSTTPTVDFWFDLASTYSYLAVSRADDAAAAAGVTLRWLPFSLGPVFQAAGWSTSPFVALPVKGRYMWRDIGREAERIGVPFGPPTVFPCNTILALRVALLGMQRGWGARFARAAMTAHFGHDRDLSQPEVVDEVLASLGLDGKGVRREAESPEQKPALRGATTRAMELGIFGAPTFVVGEELFWGNDRMERAFDWALGRRARATASL